MVRDFSEAVQVKGLKELQSQLRLAEPAMAKRLQEVNKALVQRIAEQARAAMPSPRTSRHGPAGYSNVAASIKGTASGREARIVAGGTKKSITFFGFEFGGSRGVLGSANARFVTHEKAESGTDRTRISKQGGIRHFTRQFPPWNNKQGNFLYPTVRAARETAMDQWLGIFDEIFGETP